MHLGDYPEANPRAATAGTQSGRVLGCGCRTLTGGAPPGLQTPLPPGVPNLSFLPEVAKIMYARAKDEVAKRDSDVADLTAELAACKADCEMKRKSALMGGVVRNVFELLRTLWGLRSFHVCKADCVMKRKSALRGGVVDSFSNCFGCVEVQGAFRRIDGV